MGFRSSSRVVSIMNSFPTVHSFDCLEAGLEVIIEIGTLTNSTGFFRSVVLSFFPLMFDFHVVLE